MRLASGSACWPLAASVKGKQVQRKHQPLSSLTFDSPPWACFFWPAEILGHFYDYYATGAPA